MVLTFQTVSDGDGVVVLDFIMLSDGGGVVVFTFLMFAAGGGCSLHCFKTYKLNYYIAHSYLKHQAGRILFLK